jgi:carboxypeptidase PM20D1
MKAPLNILFGNISVFSPIIKKIMMGIPAARAMLSTGVSFTALSGGDIGEPHLRAKEATVTMFLRCVREDELERGLSKIKKIAEKWGVEIELTERDYCKPTSFDSAAYKSVEALLNKNFPDVVVVPFLLTAGTDARRLTDVAENILRFAPIDLSKKQFATIHADNEHIGIKNIGECVVFYKDFIKMQKGDSL